MSLKTKSAILFFLLLVAFMPGFLRAKGTSTFQKDLVAFQKNTRDEALREKLIQDVLALKKAPATPHQAMILKKAGDEALRKSKFKEAVLSLKKASDLAPWNAGVYLGLAQAQEKSGLTSEAIQSLELYLLAAPGANDRQDVQGRITNLVDENKKWMMTQIDHLEVESVANSLAARLTEMGPAAKVEVPFLTKALKNNDVDTRANAAMMLGVIGPLAGEAIGPLADRLDDPNPRVRGSAAVAISKLGPEAVQALRALTYALTDDDVNVRIGASCALGNIGPGAAGAVPPLIKVLKDKDPKVRGNSAYALGKIGSSAESALPILESLSKDPDPIVKKNAAWAIKQIKSKAK